MKRYNQPHRKQRRLRTALRLAELRVEDAGARGDKDALNQAVIEFNTISARLTTEGDNER